MVAGWLRRRRDCARHRRLPDLLDFHFCGCSGRGPYGRPGGRADRLNCPGPGGPGARWCDVRPGPHFGWLEHQHHR